MERTTEINVHANHIKEMHLEEIANSLENFQSSKAPPIFELYASLVAMSLSILLFSLPGVFHQGGEFYQLMKLVLPQYGWAIAFFSVGIASSLGMLFDNYVTRVIALIAMALVYGITAVFYIISFPNIGCIFMFWMAVFTVGSIPMVKYTGLRK